MNDDHRPYHAVFHPPYPGLNYRVARPFQRWQAPHLLASMKAWLAQNPPRLELATLALEELRHRDHRSKILRAEMIFAEKGLPPIEWLLSARLALARAFPADWPEWLVKGQRGGTVYALLRDGYVAQGGPYGVYVGSTTKSLERRFMEHRQSSRAGRGMQAHGIEPLFSLCLPEGKAPRARKKLMAWETRLHVALKGAGMRVSGDVVETVARS